MSILDSAPCLRIFLLGPSWVEWQGQPLDICRKQARALLYRLAARMQPIPREELCFTFWPDVPEAVAHRHLSHLISHVRQSLPMPTIIRTRNELVELDASKAWSDAATFWSFCTPPEASQLVRLQQALEIYRGPFLSGFSLSVCPEFGAWVAEERGLFQQLYLDTLTFVMSAEASQADYSKAIFYGRRYLKVDSQAEEMHRRLMLLHLMAGDRAAALQQYEHCVTTLKRTLGIDPLPETRAVYDAILQNIQQ